MFLVKIKNFFKELQLVGKIITFFKMPVPGLATIQAGILIILAIVEVIKNSIIKKNQDMSDKNILVTDETTKAINVEIAKPLPEQDNAILREEALRRHNANK